MAVNFPANVVLPLYVVLPFIWFVALEIIKLSYVTIPVNDVRPAIVPPSPTFKESLTNKEPFKDVSEATDNPPLIETSLMNSLTDIFTNLYRLYK